jgi:hypothetical protein
MMHRPMPLVRIPEAFDHPDWVFELRAETPRILPADSVCDRHAGT